MGAERTLDGTDRALLQLVSDAVVHNPFGPERARVDARLDELAPGAPGADLNVRVRAALRARLGAPSGALDPSRFDPADRTLIERAVLYDLFHQHREDFEVLIRRQAEEPGAPVSAPFAHGLVRALVAAGLPIDTARRYVAIFWQMWRAYTYIAQDLVGQGPSMQRLRARLWDAVFTRDIAHYEQWLTGRMEDFSTLILGETGTGKGNAAAALGRAAHIPLDGKDRAFVACHTESFVALNLAEFPEGLLESELFGHKKGAFTGAVESHEGVLTRCSAHGAVFLDEIGDVSPGVQIKLLRVLQERTFSPVGSHERRRFSGRVLAATHRDLDELRASGQFRDDFYFRLCAHVIEMPPLRRRLEECPAELDELTAALLRRVVGRPAPELAGELVEAIRRDLGPDYPWPGNVRELEQSIRRVLIEGRTSPERLRAAGEPADRLRRAIELGDADAGQLLEDYCAVLHQRHGTYEAVARITGLDRRTVKKYVDRARDR